MACNIAVLSSRYRLFRVYWNGRPRQASEYSSSKEQEEPLEKYGHELEKGGRSPKWIKRNSQTLEMYIQNPYDKK